MALVLVLLLLMELHCQLAYSRNITISDDGNNSTRCCVDGDCSCSSLQHALQNIKSDTEHINIISSQVLLPTVVTISNQNTIEIVGNKDTVVACNDTGGILFLNCTNVSISGITWDHCGGASAGGVSVNYSECLLINSCKFQNSLAYGLIVEAMSGNITITDTEILNNSMSSNSTSGFLLHQINKKAKLEVNVINCSFKFNGHRLGCDGGGIKVQTTGLTSLLSVSIEDCVISNNHATKGGGIFVDAQANSLAMKFTNVTVTSNYATSGNAIYCYIPGGNNASFTVIGGSSVIEGSSIHLHFASTITSISMEDLAVVHADVQYMLFHIESYSNSSLTISFSDMNFTRTRIQLRINQHPESCILKFNELIVSNNSSLSIDGSKSNGFQCIITNCSFSNNSDNIAVVNIYNRNPDSTHVSTIKIVNSSFTHNRNGDSVVRLMYDDDNNPPLGEVQLSSTTFANNIDNDNTLYLYYCDLTISNKTIFKGNSAIKGAGIYFTNLSIATLQSHANMEFIDNTAALGGGAIYVEYLTPGNPADCPYYIVPWPLFHTANEYTAIFINNHAHAAGNSIFFSIPKDYAQCIDRNLSSKNSLLHIATHFNYSGPNEIATSPYDLQLGVPAICNSSCSDGGIYQVKGVMLGEEFSIVTKMADYYNNSAEPTLFEIKCSENCQHYKLTGSDNFEYKFILTNKTINISIIGDEVKTDSVIVLEMSSVVGTINSDVRAITVKIEVTLTPCHFGFVYNNDTDKKKCLCNNMADIVQCGIDGIRLKRGYWYGKIGDSIVVGYCPNNFCNYATSCKSSDKFCDLSKFPDDQCNLHRTGPACGKCLDNYTLTYDSTNCVPDSHCSAWWIALIVVLTVIYWLAVSFTIIFMMYFITAPTMLGYVYGITYFYSVIDLLVSTNDLPISNGLVQFIENLSGLVNLTPRFLGTLCLAKGLNGIDQQFIHYVHPFAMSLLLLLIPKVAKYCRPLTDTLNRVGTVRSLCLLLLLCYTSVSSTSLKLLLPLMFKGTHTSYAYYSPDIKYFTGRHIFYGIVAICLTVVIVLGLPVFLLLQPLMRRCPRIQFIKIQHILDQFQQCYKKEYHWAAGIYLICRLLIFVIVGLNSVEYVTGYFVLQVLCFILVVVHIILRPYEDDKVNSLDNIILLIAVMVVGLNTNNLFTSLSADKAVNDFIVVMFVLLPLISFIGFILLTLKEKYSRRNGYVELDNYDEEHVDN